MTTLQDITEFCDARTRRSEIKDFPGALNGLQFSNNGEVSKIGAAVDAGLEPFRKAVEAGVDFLIVHHGMHWGGARPRVGVEYEKTKALIQGNTAVYASHLPLDAHAEIGNNAILAQKIGATQERTFLPYEGNDIGLIAKWGDSRQALNDKLRELFDGKFTAIEHGSTKPERIAILTGSGTSAVDHLQAAGVDTLVTGELKQHLYNQAEEEKLNLYACGHYATETYGVCALAAEAAATFGLEWEFIETDCPL